MGLGPIPRTLPWQPYRQTSKGLEPAFACVLGLAVQSPLAGSRVGSRTPLVRPRMGLGPITGTYKH